MTITISAGEVQHGPTWQSYETLTQATATTIQTLNNNMDVSILGMGTATGFTRNKYLLSTSGAVEGQEKVIISHATGEANVIINNVGPTQGVIPFSVALVLYGGTATTVDSIGLASATGSLVFQAADDYVRMKYMAGSWRYLDAVGATFATTT